MNDHKGAKNLIEEVYATAVPASRFKEPEVQQAMKEEEDKWLGYGAYEVVPDNGQEHLTMRWVINQKEQADGQKTDYKARLCVRGYQENIVPRSDSPTAPEEPSTTARSVA